MASAPCRNEATVNLGIFTGRSGRDRLLTEIEKLLGEKNRVVVAVEGLPGAGKTHWMKHIVRFGYGPFSRREIAVIDDNTLYETRLWSLRWTKLQIDKPSWQAIADGLAARVIFFSNWVPSRFINAADILVRVKAADETRRRRLRRRYRSEPEKFRLQGAKTDMPLEPPFACSREMILYDPCWKIFGWEIGRLLRRGLAVGRNTLG